MMSGSKSTMTDGRPHIPVMAREVVESLAPRDGATYADGTFGAGGYSRAVLESADCTVVGIDRDPDAIAGAAELKAAYPKRLTLIEGRFGDIEALLSRAGIKLIDGVTLDLGVSSMQIDRPERGFSFRSDGPLDMRMERTGTSAADVVNDSSEEELARIIREFGEDRRARRIAKAIVAARQDGRISRTGQLAEIVRRASGGRAHQDIDPATRTFQALRIVTNSELDELSSGLRGAEAVLKAGGRLAVVTFHSLEDRIVKTFLRRRTGTAPRGSRHLPDAGPGPAPSFRLLSRRAIAPTAREIAANPRARSARLRTAERTDAAPFPREAAE